MLVRTKKLVKGEKEEVNVEKTTENDKGIEKENIKKMKQKFNKNDNKNDKKDKDKDEKKKSKSAPPKLKGNKKEVDKDNKKEADMD